MRRASRVASHSRGAAARIAEDRRMVVMPDDAMTQTQNIKATTTAARTARRRAAESMTRAKPHRAAAQRP